MNLYNLKSLAPNTYALAKFDADFNVLAVYNLAPKGHSYTCDCPANQRSVVTKPCKHKRFLPFMLGAVNTDRFFDPETGSWHQPLGDMHRVEPEPELTAEEIEDMPDGAEKDHHHAMQEALFGPVEPPEGLVGEALGSSAEPLNLPPYSGPPVDHSEAILAADLKLTGPSAASPAPTIRRR